MSQLKRTSISQLELIKQLVIRDFRSRYAGSLFGLFWALAQPLAMMGILWFVFTHGLKAGTQDNVSFVCWFFAANIAWNFFFEATIGATNVLHEYSYLVKKVNFRLAILPAVKILSALILHSIFILILVIILLVNGIYPTWAWLQVVYYTFSLSALLLGMGLLLSSLNVFLKDVAQVIGIILQFGFWLTPIIWNVNQIPEKWRFLVDLNPLAYITEGYRRSFLYDEPFWKSGFQGLYFWGFTIVIFLCGRFVFLRLRKHFADLL